MRRWRDLPLRDPGWGEARDLRMVVETPRGSDVKLKYNEELDLFEWSRPLTLGVRFPYDFGFLPQTLADDGDAVDALLFSEAASHPGVVVRGRVIGALRVEQQRDGQPTKRNDRVIVLPHHEHRRGHLSTVADMSERMRQEIEAFFTASLLLTGKTVRFLGWAEAAEANTLVDAAAQRFADERVPATR